MAFSNCSKLYTILKSPDSLKIPSVTPSTYETNAPPAKRSKDNGSEQLWKCWECMQYFDDEVTLLNHLKQCSLKCDDPDELCGCPFCPRDINLPIESPFSISSFNAHLNRCHPNVDSLVCSYCLKSVKANLQDLISHVMLTHKIPWRPSPASLSHMRETQLPHRVVTCLGCGWCTFVLRANNTAQPPNSLETHMGRCAFNGGRVQLTPLTKDMYESALGNYKTLQEAEQISTVFAKAFPLVRGYGLSDQSPTSQVRVHRYIRGGCGSPKNVPLKQEAIEPQSALPIGKVKTNTTTSQVSKMSSDNLNDKMGNAKEVIFDIPLTLPPPPPTVRNGYKKPAPIRLFVCPLCGDNALASLRERDEHLQASHNGELVFPCQICGMAYPFYIALRRHAALQHNSDFDAVRYGPPDLLESEPLECPECQLVAFQDPLVLKLHVSRMHKKITSPLNQSLPLNTSKDNESVLAIDFNESSGGSEHQPDTRSEMHKIMNFFRGGRGSTGRTRGRPRGSKSKPKALTTDTDVRIELTDSNTVTDPVNVKSTLETLLSSTDGSCSLTNCPVCHLQVHNAKELHLHTELEHSTSNSEIEQLGCQACGRVFFGSGGRIDLIGHLRVLHQDNTVLNALKCPHAERPGVGEGVENTCPSETLLVSRHCEAMFASPRLRQLHLSAIGNQTPDFACPMKLDLGDTIQSALERTRQLILATEVQADKDGLMILAYCCPTCSHVFAGEDADSRFNKHREHCRGDVEQSEPITLKSSPDLHNVEMDIKQSE